MATSHLQLAALISLFAASSAAAQSNPYVMVEDFESGSLAQWNTTVSHVTSPGECGIVSPSLALNDGAGTCAIGASFPGTYGVIGQDQVTFHPTQPMEFLFDFRNDLPINVHADVIGYWPIWDNGFIIEYLGNNGGDGLWHSVTTSYFPTEWDINQGIQGLSFPLFFRTWDDGFGGSGGAGVFFDNVIVRPRGNGTAFCAGSACPCANDATHYGMGCTNSSGKSGWLHGYGNDSLAASEIEFVAGGLLSGQPSLLFQGTTQLGGGTGLPFGDGLRCVGGSVQRLGTQIPDSTGTATWTGVATPAGWTAGQTARLQVYYRDPAGSPCGSGFNTTNGYELTLLP